jgi:hypothetical protein
MNKRTAKGYQANCKDNKRPAEEKQGHWRLTIRHRRETNAIAGEKEVHRGREISAQRERNTRDRVRKTRAQRGKNRHIVERNRETGALRNFKEGDLEKITC